MLDADVDAIAEMTRQELKAKWRSLFCEAPPAKISRKLMIQMVSSKLQWNASGLSKARLLRRLERLNSEGRVEYSPRIKPGTRLVREWHGTRHIVDVTDDGFTWQNKTWRSLSVIAREITGARWSGPRFFGVNGKA